MNEFDVLQSFRDREGKDLEKLSLKEVAALPVYFKDGEYQSDNEDWTDYLQENKIIKAKAGNKKSTEKKEVIEPEVEEPVKEETEEVAVEEVEEPVKEVEKPAPKKRTTRKKASE